MVDLEVHVTDHNRADNCSLHCAEKLVPPVTENRKGADVLFHIESYDLAWVVGLHGFQTILRPEPKTQNSLLLYLVPKSSSYPFVNFLFVLKRSCKIGK